MLLFLASIALVRLLLPFDIPVWDRRSFAIPLIGFFYVMVSILSLSFYDYTLIILQVIIVKFAVKLIQLLDPNGQLIPDDL